MDANHCTDCKKSTGVIFDHTVGYILCSECGLVLNSKNDPVRVGGPINPLLSNGAGLSTFISMPNRGTIRANDNPDRANDNPDRVVPIRPFDTIATMADRLALVSTITDRASEIYKKVKDQRASRGRNQIAIVAACLFIACRQEGKSRTVKEICSVAYGATKREISRAITSVKELEVDMGTIHPEECLRRFCSTLGMNNLAIMAAQEAFVKSEEFDIRRNPISIAAAIITQILDDRRALPDISVATGVAEGTIKNTYKDLYPHFSKIIPSWFAKGEDLKYICR